MARLINGIARVAYPTVTMIVLLVVWEVGCRVLDVPKFILPTPLQIVEGTWSIRAFLPYHLWVTTYETLAGFALSIAVGTPLAVLIVYSRFFRRAFYPLLVVTQAVPKVAFAPVLLLILGNGQMPKIFVAFLVAFFPIVVDTATGLAATPPELLELSRTYRTGAIKTLFKVRFPMALPYFFSGLKVAIALSVTGAVVAEFVGSDAGLGYVIVSATAFWRSEQAFGAMILLALIAVVLFGLVGIAERLLCPWYAKGN